MLDSAIVLPILYHTVKHMLTCNLDLDKIMLHSLQIKESFNLKECSHTYLCCNILTRLEK